MTEEQRKNLVWECEHHYLLPYEEGARQIPFEEAREILVENARNRYPTGVGRHPELGWFVISSGGQGPIFDWTEWETDEDTN